MMVMGVENTESLSYFSSLHGPNDGIGFSVNTLNILL